MEYSKAVDVTVIITAMTDPEEQWFHLALTSVLRQSLLPRRILVLVCETNLWVQREIESLSAKGLDTSLVIVRPIPMARLGSVRNTGVLMAESEWVAFLDGDDVWLPTKLEKQLAVAKSMHIGFVGTDYVFVTSNGKHFGFSNGSTPTPSSWLVRTDVMKRYQFDPEIKEGEDHLWLKTTKGHVCRARLPEVLVEYRIRAGSISAAKANSTLRLFREFAARCSNFAPVRVVILLLTYLRYRVYQKKPYDV